jgi:hypothetical protein
MGSERVESSADEYETPDDDPRYDKWYELLIGYIWGRELDEWDPITHQSDRICDKKCKSHSAEFEDTGKEEFFDIDLRHSMRISEKLLTSSL